MSAGELLAQRYEQQGQADKIEHLPMTYSDEPTIDKNYNHLNSLCKLYC